MTDFSPIDEALKDAHTTYLSHCDLAIDLNNFGCDMTMEAASDANGTKKSGERVLLLLGHAIDTYRDALGALGRPAVPVNSASALEEYVAFRAELLSRAQDRTNEAANAKLPSSQRGRPQDFEARINPLVYATPIRLDDEPLQDNSGSQSAEEVSAAVLFNIALAHHLRAEYSGSKGYVQRAVRFYKMTETMVSKALLLASANHHIATIVKGVLNNMGQICIQWMGEPQLGKEYFARLAAIASEEVRGQSREETDAGPQMDEFTFNAMVTSGMNTASAA